MTVVQGLRLWSIAYTVEDVDTGASTQEEAFVVTPGRTHVPATLPEVRPNNQLISIDEVTNLGPLVHTVRTMTEDRAALVQQGAWFDPCGDDLH